MMIVVIMMIVIIILWERGVLKQRAAFGDDQFKKIENVVEVFVTRDEDN